MPGTIEPEYFSPDPDAFDAWLWELHNGPEVAEVRATNASAFDPTRSWVDANGYTLDDRLWNQGQNIRQAIDDRLQLALMNGEDALDVAKDLEQYLRPEAQPLKSKGGRYIKGGGSITRAPRSGSGSYPARRLARTEISHAMGSVTKQTTAALGIDVKWGLANRHPEPDICDGFATASSHGCEPGVYHPHECPWHPAHPQCLCALIPHDDRTDDEIVDYLAKKYRLDPEPGDIGYVAPKTPGIDPHHVTSIPLPMPKAGTKAAKSVSKAKKAKAAKPMDVPAPESIAPKSQPVSKVPKPTIVADAVPAPAVGLNAPMTLAETEKAWKDAGVAFDKALDVAGSDVRQAWQRYKGLGYEDINYYLRTGQIEGAPYRKGGQDVPGLAAHVKNPAPLQAFDRTARVARELFLTPESKSRRLFENMVPGSEYTEPGVMSTAWDILDRATPSSLDQIANYTRSGTTRVVMDLTVPAGTPFAPLEFVTKDGLNYYGAGDVGESELAFPPGSRIQVTGVSVDGPVRTITGTILPPVDTPRRKPKPKPKGKE